MNLYLEGSRSPSLEKGLSLLKDMSERNKESMLGAKLAMTVANSFTYPFYDLEQRTGVSGENLKLTRSHDADPEAALDLTTAAVDLFQKSKQKALNLSYRQLVSQRVDCFVAMDEPDAAIKELSQLHEHLSNNGANAPVLEQINIQAGTIRDTAAPQFGRHRLWERVRVHDQLATAAKEEHESGGGISVFAQPIKLRKSSPRKTLKGSLKKGPKATAGKKGGKKSTQSRKSPKKR
jgi:hypothetical protein